MTAKPTVSVVTISFRDLDGLERTTKSVRSQDYDGRIEHIVIDGGSGAEVVDYLRSHADGYAHWQSQPDNGRYDAMNQGIAHASGDLVWFMHSGDCFSDPGAIAAVVQALQGYGSVDELWGYGQVNRIDAEGGSLGVWGFVPFDLTKFGTGAHPVPHQGAFFGSAFLRRIGDYDLDFGISADQLFMLRAAIMQRPVTLERVVCDFDTTGVGSVQSVKQSFDDMRRAWRQLDYYPLGSRRKSLAYLKYREYRSRFAYPAVAGLRGVLAPVRAGT